MGCLDELIGLDNSCASVTGTLYLGDIGMTEEKILNFVREGDSKEVFLAKIRRHTSAFVASDVLTRTAARIKPHTFLAAQRIGNVNEQQTVLSGDAGTVGGIVVDIVLTNSNIKQLISSIGFYGKLTGTLALKVYDLDDGVEVDAQDLTVIADQISTTEVDLQYQALRQRKRYFITHPELSYYQVDINAGGCTNCGEGVFRQAGVSIFGARIDNAVSKNWSNLQRVSHTSGLTVVTTIACDHAAFLCEIKGSLALPLLYKQAEEITRYGLFNRTRFNEDKFNAEDLAKEAEFYAGKYSESMDNLLKNMPLPDDNVCYVCNTRSRHIVMVP